MEEKETSYAFVRRKRKESGLTGEEFAKSIGTSKAVISLWENGRTNISGAYKALIISKYGK
jgi:DNA-binding transcriptional regulator YiaG